MPFCGDKSGDPKLCVAEPYMYAQVLGSAMHRLNSDGLDPVSGTVPEIYPLS
jgi:hypothetical protein